MTQSGLPVQLHKYNAKLPGLARALGASLLTAVLLTGCAGAPVPEPVQAEPPPPAQPAEPRQTFVPAPRAPERYVVKKGDTLWDISAMFLQDPWLWPEIWYVNPQIENPHLIYPGDIITIVWIDGRPYLQVERDGVIVQTTRREVRLTPQIRTMPLDQAIPTIPLEAIRAFLSRSYVVDDDELEDAPYLLRSVDGRLMSGAANRVYVRGLTDPTVLRYSVVRPGDEYEDPETGDTLGYEALFVGSGEIIRGGDPATMLLTNTKREALAGDRLIPAGGDTFNANFIPHAAEPPVQGRIISVIDGVSQIGQFMIVVLNKGEADGVNTGTVFAIYQKGANIGDPYAGLLTESVQLPDERAGLALVFRTFDRVSYALVMRATSEIHMLDVVRNP